MNVQNEDEYEDRLSLWSDLESGLGIILRSPASIQEFEKRVRQYDRWMRELVQQDTDLGLYLLFQLAANSPVGYSASHALICSVLCHLMAGQLILPKMERDSLVHAAMTMNIAMTALQDQMAQQVEKPSAVQQDAIAAHPANSSALLESLGVTDQLWLSTVGLHHDETTDKGAWRLVAPATRLARILRIVDRYAAMISPRRSREGRSATDSMRSIVAKSSERQDEISHSLVRAVGLSPPGTYVRLDNGELAVVVRRSIQPNLPDVAIVAGEDAQLFNAPRLHHTAEGGPRIKAALPASALHEQRLNHHQILHLA